MPTRWGIISAGKISNDFVAAMQCLPKQEHTIIGVAARYINNAKEFANNYKIPHFYGSYEELLKNPDVEVVYIGVVHPQHFQVAKLSLEHGKNVLCEKPLCMNERETRALVEFAKKRNLFLMEAVWSRCFPAYEHLRTLLAKNEIGQVLHLNVQFGAKIDVARMWKKELGGGTVLDIGIYTIQIATLVFGNNNPSTIVAAGHLNAEGVDEDMTAIFTYPNGATAVLSSHSKVALPNTAVIVGTRGRIEIQAPFWAPTKITVSYENVKEEMEFPLPQSKECFNFVNSVGLSYEAAEVRKCLITDKLESPIITHEDSIHLAKLEDEIRRQLGVHYQQDDI